MDKIYLVDLLVWENHLLPTKPRLSLRTHFKVTNCSVSPAFCHATNTRLAHVHIPNPGSQVAVMTKQQFQWSIWTQTWRTFFVRSCPQRKLNLTKKLQWNRLGFEMAAGLTTWRGTWKLRQGEVLLFLFQVFSLPVQFYCSFVPIISVHSIIKNAQKWDKQCVNIGLESCSPLGGNKYKLVPKATSHSCDMPPIPGLFLGSRASRFQDSEHGIVATSRTLWRPP